MFKGKALPLMCCVLASGTTFADIRSLVVNQMGSTYNEPREKNESRDFAFMMGTHFLSAGIVSGVGTIKTTRYSARHLFKGIRLGYQGFKSFNQGTALNKALFSQAGISIGKGTVAASLAIPLGLLSAVGLELGGAAVYIATTEKEK